MPRRSIRALVACVGLAVFSAATCEAARPRGHVQRYVIVQPGAYGQPPQTSCPLPVTGYPWGWFGAYPTQDYFTSGGYYPDYKQHTIRRGY